MLMISEIIWNETKYLFEKTSKIGRPSHDARLAMSGIWYIMQTGAQWRNLPDTYGKYKTIHSKFMLWSKNGMIVKFFIRSVEIAIEHLGVPKALITDTYSSKAPFAKFGGKNPTDRAKNGVKKGIVIDWNRIILSVVIDSANRHDSQLLLPHIDNIKPFLGNPMVLAADSAWDSKKLRNILAKFNLALHASTNRRRSKNKKQIRPGGRWRVEQIFGIQQWNRGIKSCWTKTKESFLALCQFASAIHNFRLAGIFG